MKTEKSTFDVLSSINCNEHTEKKNGLTYLSWAWAWGIVKKTYPSANYEVTMWDNRPYLYDENLGYLVQTTVSIDGERIGMQLPVMDGANKAMKEASYTYQVKEYKGGKWTGGFTDKSVEAATMFDINTAIMRCLTKNLAMFGLGHYIYAGEDLPEDENKQAEPAKRIEPAKEPAKPDLLVSDKEKFEAAKCFVESSLKSGKQPFAILQEIRTRYSVPLETQIALNL